MDVLYVVRRAPTSEELRYSLRSLTNLPHDRVFIVGHAPEWVSNVVHVRSEPKEAGKSKRVLLNLKVGLESDVSDRFVFMNDDFYIMTPHTEIPVFHRGPLALLAKGRLASDRFTQQMHRTIRYLKSKGVTEPLSYDLTHTPLVVDKAGFRRAVEVSWGMPPMLHRSVYGNLQQLGGVEGRDVKFKDYRDLPFLSTSDESFKADRGEFIRSRFPDPGPYEC